MCRVRFPACRARRGAASRCRARAPPGTRSARAFLVSLPPRPVPPAAAAARACHTPARLSRPRIPRPRGRPRPAGVVALVGGHAHASPRGGEMPAASPWRAGKVAPVVAPAIVPCPAHKKRRVSPDARRPSSCPGPTSRGCPAPAPSMRPPSRPRQRPPQLPVSILFQPSARPRVRCMPCGCSSLSAFLYMVSSPSPRPCPRPRPCATGPPAAPPRHAAAPGRPPPPPRGAPAPPRPPPRGSPGGAIGGSDRGRARPAGARLTPVPAPPPADPPAGCRRARRGRARSPAR